MCDIRLIVRRRTTGHRKPSFPPVLAEVLPLLLGFLPRFFTPPCKRVMAAGQGLQAVREAPDRPFCDDVFMQVAAGSVTGLLGRVYPTWQLRPASPSMARIVLARDSLYHGPASQWTVYLTCLWYRCMAERGLIGG